MQTLTVVYVHVTTTDCFSDELVDPVWPQLNNMTRAEKRRTLTAELQCCVHGTFAALEANYFLEGLRCARVIGALTVIRYLRDMKAIRASQLLPLRALVGKVSFYARSPTVARCQRSCSGRPFFGHSQLQI